MAEEVTELKEMVEREDLGGGRQSHVMCVLMRYLKLNERDFFKTSDEKTMKTTPSPG